MHDRGDTTTMTHYRMQLIVPIDDVNTVKMGTELAYLEKCFQDITGSFTSYSEQLYRVYSLICTEEQSDILSKRTRGRCALLELAPHDEISHI
jgi:hypothetical protein